MILLILINIVEKTYIFGTNFFMIAMEFPYSMTLLKPMPQRWNFTRMFPLSIIGAIFKTEWFCSE